MLFSATLSEAHELRDEVAFDEEAVPSRSKVSDAKRGQQCLAKPCFRYVCLLSMKNKNLSLLD